MILPPFLCHSQDLQQNVHRQHWNSSEGCRSCSCTGDCLHYRIRDWIPHPSMPVEWRKPSQDKSAWTNHEFIQCYINSENLCVEQNSNQLCSSQLYFKMQLCLNVSCQIHSFKGNSLLTDIKHWQHFLNSRQPFPFLLHTDFIRLSSP